MNSATCKYSPSPMGPRKSLLTLGTALPSRCLVNPYYKHCNRSLGWGWLSAQSACWKCEWSLHSQNLSKNCTAHLKSPYLGDGDQYRKGALRQLWPPYAFTCVPFYVPTRIHTLKIGGNGNSNTLKSDCYIDPL